MYNRNDYNGITEASEARESARLDDEYDAIKDALHAEELEAERTACAIGDAEEDALIFQARAKDDDAIEARIAAAKANPVTAALDGWIRGQIAARPRAYAFIAPGIAVRVGTGKRRRAA